MGHTATGVMTLPTTSMNMQALTVTTACKFPLSASCSTIVFVDIVLIILSSFQCRYPDKDAQYHFFRNYLQPDKPLEVKQVHLTLFFFFF